MGYAKLDFIPPAADSLTTWLSPCRVATTANITLSGAQTIDGIAVVATDRVLVKNQTLPAENGVYVAAAGAWSRATDTDSAAELNFSAVSVVLGTVGAGKSFIQTSVIGTLGVDAVVWADNGVYLSNATPSDVGASASAGTSAQAARADHSHGTATVTPTASKIPIADSAGKLSAWNKITENAQTGTTYQLVAGDAFNLVSLTNAAAITLTVPTNAVTPFAIGTQIDLVQGGAGKVTVGGAGVTINSKDGNKSIGGQYVGVSLVKLATDTWILVGDLIA